MLITDARHFLDEKGAIGPKAGPGRVLAEFLSSVVAAATVSGCGHVASCRKCGAEVMAEVGAAGRIVWRCTACAEQGAIDGWRGTLWDLSASPGQAQ